MRPAWRSTRRCGPCSRWSPRHSARSVAKNSSIWAITACDRVSSDRLGSAGRAQRITGAADGVQHRVLEALVDLGPQAADMNVDHVGLRIEMMIPDFFQKHRACHDMIGIAHEIFEEAE